MGKGTQLRLRWYAVRCDNKRAVERVNIEIGRLGIRSFVPVAFRQERRGKWLVNVPDGYLFPPYIFVAMRAPGPWKSRSSILWGNLAEVKGVARIMGYHNAEGDLCPIPIPYREMRKIRTRDKPGRAKKVEAKFKPGQCVKIMAGPFAGFDGVFEMPVKDRVRVLTSIFGRATPVELDEQDVRAA